MEQEIFNAMCAPHKVAETLRRIIDMFDDVVVVIESWQAIPTNEVVNGEDMVEVVVVCHFEDR